MKQAILPMIGYLILQVPVTLAGMNLVRARNRAGVSFLMEAWVVGQMLLLAVMQVMAVPMILLRCSFSALFWSYVGVCAVIAGFGIAKCRKTTWVRPGAYLSRRKETSLYVRGMMIFAMVLICLQAVIYFLGIHLDEDDARWLAEANDMLTYGDMMLRNYSTGEFLDAFLYVPRDLTSPWPVMYAVVSRLLWNTRASIVAHTLYATVEVFALYGIYWLIGRELFEKIEARVTFLAGVGIINFFCAGTVYTQSVFSMVRIWQGKATVAGVVLPLLLCLFLRLNRRGKISRNGGATAEMAREDILDWLKIAVTGTAACLMSGMGITLGLIFIGVYGAYDLLVYRRWRRIPLYLLSLAPGVITTAVYFWIRGGF